MHFVEIEVNLTFVLPPSIAQGPKGASRLATFLGNQWRNGMTKCGSMGKAKAGVWTMYLLPTRRSSAQNRALCAGGTCSITELQITHSKCASGQGIVNPSYSTIFDEWILPSMSVDVPSAAIFSRVMSWAAMSTPHFCQEWRLPPKSRIRVDRKSGAKRSSFANRFRLK